MSGRLLLLVHIDVWYAPLTPMYGHGYFVLFIDDTTRCTCIYLLKLGDEVVSKFKNFHKMIETKLDRKIEVSRSDNGGE